MGTDRRQLSAERRDRDAIRTRVETATPEPWEEAVVDIGDRYDVTVRVLRGGTGRTVRHLSGGFGHPSAEDRAFIAAARSDVPALLDDCDALAGALRERVLRHQRRVHPGLPTCPGCRDDLALLDRLGYGAEQ